MAWVDGKRPLKGRRDIHPRPGGVVLLPIVHIADLSAGSSLLLKRKQLLICRPILWATLLRKTFINGDLADVLECSVVPLSTSGRKC